MIPRAPCLIGVCIVVLGVASNASAQEQATLPLPVAEASAGYAFMRETTMAENFPAGWYFSTAARTAVDYRRIVFTVDDEFAEDNSQVRASAGVVLGWGAR